MGDQPSVSATRTESAPSGRGPAVPADPLLIRALRREPVERTPVWFMRQAGRSLPEYRDLRRGVPMLELCRTPDLCAEVTLQPVRRHRVDAAILFSDIVTPLEAIGIEVEIRSGVGPVVAEPFRSRADLGRLRPFEPEADREDHGVQHPEPARWHGQLPGPADRDRGRGCADGLRHDQGRRRHARREVEGQEGAEGRRAPSSGAAERPIRPRRKAAPEPARPGTLVTGQLLGPGSASGPELDPNEAPPPEASEKKGKLPLPEEAAGILGIAGLLLSGFALESRAIAGRGR